MKRELVGPFILFSSLYFYAIVIHDGIRTIPMTVFITIGVVLFIITDILTPMEEEQKRKDKEQYTDHMNDTNDTNDTKGDKNERA